MSAVLVINSGSSSFKYQLIDVATERQLASGLVERIGEVVGRARHDAEQPNDPAVARVVATSEREAEIPDHTAGFALMLEAFAEHGPSLEEAQIVAVGHRVVQGGKRFFEPTLITDLVEINIEDLADLAPLHNPGALQGIRAARKAFAEVPHVAVFDTAFHRTIPDAAATYAIDRELAERHRIRRYGFHGTSHKYVSEKASEALGIPYDEFNAIVLHLGNGASVCAVEGGRSVETSMGMTPLQGLVMGTRSGDVDPAVLIHLQRRAGLDAAGLDDLLNKRSGLLGLAGSGDMRDVLARAEEGDADAQLAIDVYLHRLRHYLGAYYAQLGRVDAIVFTAGVGENNAVIRARALAGLERLGIVMDEQANLRAGRGERVISAPGSEVSVLVVPTNEELEIAKQTAQLVAR